MPNIGPGELILLLLIALVVLGPSKLPDVAQSLGKSLREFRKAATDVSEATKLEPTAAAPAASTTPAVNSLTGEAAPNTLGDSAASSASGDDSAQPPAA